MALAHLGQEFRRDRINHAASQIYLSTVTAPIAVVSVGGRENFRKCGCSTVIMRSLVGAMDLDGRISELRQWPRLTLFSYQM